MGFPLAALGALHSQCAASVYTRRPAWQIAACLSATPSCRTSSAEPISLRGRVPYVPALLKAAA
jgi:hypothetical protein